MRKIFIGLSKKERLREDLKRNLQTIGVCLSIMAAFCYILIVLLRPLPIVYTSYTTGKCTGVYYEGVEYPCGYLKDNSIVKYERVFVK